MNIEALLGKFTAVSTHPKAQLKRYKAEGKKVIGVFPYYTPEEPVDATDVVPMGVQDVNSQTISMAKKYCATFHCTIAQLGSEILLNSTLDELDSVVTPTIYDTLRPMSQDIRMAMGGKIPTILLAYPQDRFAEWGLQFTIDQYHEVRRQLEKVVSKAITPKALQASIKLYDRYHRAVRRFVELASKHCDVITAVKRIQVLEPAWFVAKSEYTPLLEEPNTELKKPPAAKWTDSRVATGDTIYDSPKLLQIFDDNRIAIATDGVAHESRFFKTNAPKTDDPIRNLAVQFVNHNHDILLYDPQSAKNRRDESVAELVKKSGAQGLVLFTQQFYDPEEMEYPYLKKTLDNTGIPHIKLGVDQQMRDLGQAQTAIQAFTDVLSL